MLKRDQAAQVERLLARGDLSQRQIARLAGVGRTSVATIAEKLAIRPPVGADDCPPEGSPRAVRCPGCGGRVFLPCRLCALRRGMGSANHSAAISSSR